jgi:hypothetical protein
MVVDAESFSQLRNPQQLAARDLIYEILAGSFDSAGCRGRGACMRTVATGC